MTDSFEQQALVYYDEPPVKAPPLLVVGPLAWLRNNLFSSPFNIILTLISGIVLVTGLASFVTWIVTQANWFIVIFNFRQFMLGRYEMGAEGRVILMVLVIAFVIGVALAAWARVPRGLLFLTVILVALMFILPPAIKTIPLPPTYISAGDADIVSGSSTQPPIPQWGFIARAGETVELKLAVALSSDDAQLATLNSFADVGANFLRAAAATRLRDQARIDEITTLLATNLPNERTLTDRQRATLETELGRLSVPEAVTTTTALNQTPINWRIVRGTTFETIDGGVLQPDGAAVTVTLPEDGWYILEKDGSGTGLIESRGIYPLLERNFSRGETLDDAGNVTQAAGRFSEYVRMTDSWSTLEERPRIDGDNVPMAQIIDTQYRGNGTFSDWLTLYVGNFLDLLNDGILWIVVAVAAGYGVAKLADQVLPARGKARDPRIVSRRFSLWSLIALPIVMFVLAYGVGLGDFLPFTDTRRWGGLLLTIMLTMVGIIASFPLGVLLALGRRSSLPVISIASTIYIEFVRGVPLITVLFMAQLLVPLISPSLAEFDNVFRVMVGITLFSAAYLAENVRGGLQAIPPGQEEAAKALGLRGGQVTLLITLPQALRFVIPALVGQFISLFKDTSLVAIVGLTDLSGIAQTSVAQTEFLGLRREVYLFIALVYFIFSYVMAAISRRLEASGSGAARRV